MRDLSCGFHAASINAAHDRRVRARLYRSMAVVAVVLGTAVYLALASRGDDPREDRLEPIILETRERPTRAPGDRQRPRRESRTPTSPEPPATGFAPPPLAPAAPQAEDKDDVREDDAADDVGADD
jgi:hypothetical protein